MYGVRCKMYDVEMIFISGDTYNLRTSYTKHRTSNMK